MNTELAPHVFYRSAGEWEVPEANTGSLKEKTFRDFLPEYSFGVIVSTQLPLKSDKMTYRVFAILTLSECHEKLGMLDFGRYMEANIRKKNIVGIQKNSHDKISNILISKAIFDNQKPLSAIGVCTLSDDSSITEDDSLNDFAVNKLKNVTFTLCTELEHDTFVGKAHVEFQRLLKTDSGTMTSPYRAKKLTFKKGMRSVQEGNIS